MQCFDLIVWLIRWIILARNYLKLFSACHDGNRNRPTHSISPLMGQPCNDKQMEGMSGARKRCMRVVHVRSRLCEEDVKNRISRNQVWLGTLLLSDMLQFLIPWYQAQWKHVKESCIFQLKSPQEKSPENSVWIYIWNTVDFRYNNPYGTHQKGTLWLNSVITGLILNVFYYTSGTWNNERYIRNSIISGSVITGDHCF